MKENLAKLINIKSIVTLLTTFVFCALALQKVISPEQFLQVFMMVIAFYFGTQLGKTKKVEGK